jgi:Kef-type K+ transport system membrane component KefB
MPTFHLPITDPVLVFSVILFVILLTPIVLQRLRIPSIVGLILAGVALGPHGSHVLERDQAIVLFGTVGVLYIMFLAGLEIDLQDFKRHRHKSIVYGLMTFLIPIISGTLVCQYFLGFNLVSCILISSTFSSNTLVAYPILSRLGITKNIAVNVAVGGTMITDILALLVLAIITTSTTGVLDTEFWVRLGVSFSVFSLVVLFGFPILARWFFKNMQGDSISQYVFVMAMVFLAGFLAKMAGVEPIIGAFLAGISLNKLVPHTSMLKNRLEFVGNALFIPFFLISVGMLVDLTVFWKSDQALIVAILMTTMALLGKWTAAFLTKTFFKFSRTEGSILFGLSAAHAAATLAVILEGHSIGILNDDVLNGTIVMILVTCLVSSFVVERAGRKLVLSETEHTHQEVEDEPERILVPIANPETFQNLIDFAFLIKNKQSIEPVYPLSIVTDDDASEKNVRQSNKMLEKVQSYANASGQLVQVLTRVDMNVARGISRAIKDLLITEVIIGWHGTSSPTELLFGNLHDNLLKRSEKMIFLTRIVQPLNTISRIVVVVPPKAAFEKGFGRWLNVVKTFAKQTGCDIVIWADNDTNEAIQSVLLTAKINTPIKYREFEDWEDFLILSREVAKDDLFVVVTARPGSISYQTVLDSIPKKISKHFKKTNVILLYPEQNIGQHKELDLITEGMDGSVIQENIDRLSKLGKSIKNIITND